MIDDEQSLRFVDRALQHHNFVPAVTKNQHICSSHPVVGLFLTPDAAILAYS